MKRTAFSTALMLGLAACGGGESADAGAEMESAPAAEATAEAPAASMEMTMPNWYRMDGENVVLDITAGATSTGNYWNYNGAQNGEMTISVPVGAQVTVNFSNQDPNMAHSIGIAPNFEAGSVPAMVEPTPVFEGAISAEPTSMTGATLPGESETITFVASEAGEYKVVCYIAGHLVSGMWINFVVSEDGEAGVIGAM